MAKPDTIFDRKIEDTKYTTTISIDIADFFTDARVRLCTQSKCKYSKAYIGKAKCNLTEIEIDETGRCIQQEPREKNTQPDIKD